MTTADSLEARIKEFGLEIFRKMGEDRPSVFNKQGLNGHLMEWSMKRPALKLNMFRLVDVLPVLKSSRAVADHAAEYLKEPLSQVSSLLALGLRGRLGSVRTALAAAAVRLSVNEMAKQFIAGESPKLALPSLRKLRKRGFCFTVDLLGEFCVSEKEAMAYLGRYMDALNVFAQEVPKWPESAPLMQDHPGELNPICISVKLSALYSQCNPMNFEKSVAVLCERLAMVVRRAQELNALIYVDAEDSSNNPIIYKVFTDLFSSQEFARFPYPGIVVQAYAKDSAETLAGLLRFAKKRGGPIAVRLVKGAYWDQETILSRQNQWPNPLFVDKAATDANYEDLSKMLIDEHEWCLPAFASHNVRSLAAACVYAGQRGLKPNQFELQMLYGMAQPISKAFRSLGYLVRLYVPLGEILPGMGYLVRRLLENTSNESFLRHTFFEDGEIDNLLRAPQ